MKGIHAAKVANFVQLIGDENELVFLAQHHQGGLLEHIGPVLKQHHRYFATYFLEKTHNGHGTFNAGVEFSSSHDFND